LLELGLADIDLTIGAGLKEAQLINNQDLLFP